MPDACSSERPHRIGWAVKTMKAGQAVTRRGWKVKGQSVSFVPAEGSAKAYLEWRTRSGKTWPATLGQQDLLAEDWCLAS